MKSIAKRTLILMLAVLLLFACDKKEKEKEQAKVKPEPPKPVTMLDLVPADTIFFSGGLQPAPLQEVLQWSNKNFNVLQAIDPADTLSVTEDEKMAGRRMLSQLWLDYYALILSPETKLAEWGIPEQAFLTTYTVGLAPVLLRISLKDVPQFNKKIEELEAKAKVSTEAETVGQATFHRYPLIEANPSAPSVTLIIGVDNARKHAVFMLDIGVDSKQTIAIALGQQKPEKTLAETGRVEALQKQYNLHPSFIGYVDHQQLITGLTTKEGNSIAEMLQILAPQLQQGATGFLEELQTEGCRGDFEDIGKNWPQTVFGYTALDLAATPSRIDSLLVIENKDKALLDGLRSIRGVIPQYVSNPAEAPVAAAGIGLNLQKITPFLTERWNTITRKEYHCSFFKEMQEDAKSRQPATFAMLTAMAPGVQGLAFSLASLEVEESEPGAIPMPKNIDALVSLAVENPMNLVQMLSALVPPLAELQLPADGTPVQLPLPVPVSFPVMAAVSGSHLTVFAGEKSQALAGGLRSEALDSSRGLMAATIDYGRYYGIIGDILAQLPVPEAQQQETKAIFEAMKNATMRLRMSMDATERGIEMKMDMIGTE